MKLKVIFILFLFSKTLVSQDIGYGKILPSLPNTASFEKFVEIPVNYNTGIPDITIKLFDVKNRDFKYPISLRYHAGGIKLNEIASNVGLGWSLFTGGCISRNIIGIPDDNHSSGAYYTRITPDDYKNAPIDERTIIANACISSDRDLSSDMYYFNFLDYSGKFFFDIKTKRIICNPAKPEWIIEPLFSNSGALFDGWKITTEDGTQYYFGVNSLKEEEAIDKSCIELRWSFDGNSSPKCYEDKLDRIYYPNAWYLTEIITGKQDTFKFYYTQELTKITMFSGASLSMGLGISGGPYECEENDNKRTTNYLRRNAYQCLIDSIVASTTILKFTYEDKFRKDLQGASRLARIDLYDQYHRFNKSVSFHHSHFYNSNQQAYKFLSSEVNEELKYRLRLDSIQESNGSLASPPYVFSYNSMTLPCRFSTSSDLWGYYNGIRNETLIPKTYFYRIGADQPFMSMGEADRHPQPEYAMASSLSAIKYPTGGIQTFTYEGNYIDYEVFNEHVVERANKDAAPFLFTAYEGFGKNWNASFYESDRFKDPNNSSKYFTTFNISGKYAILDFDLEVLGQKSTNPSTQIPFYPYYGAYIKNVDTGEEYGINGTWTVGGANSDNTNYGFLKRTIFLLTGQYNLFAIQEPINQDWQMGKGFTIGVKIQETPDSIACGGLRIKQIDIDEGTGNVMKKQFIYSTSNRAPSRGYPYFPLNFTIKLGIGFINQGVLGMGLSTIEVIDGDYYGHGKEISYRACCELFGLNGENGKVIRYYNVEPPVLIGYYYPLVCSQSQSLYDGTLYREYFYERFNNTFRIIKTKTYEYLHENEFSSGYIFTKHHASCQDNIFGVEYSNISTRLLKTTEELEDFTYSGNTISNISRAEYQYNNLNLQINNKLYDNNGLVYENITLYPTDLISGYESLYANYCNGVQAGLSTKLKACFELKRRNMLNTPVENLTIKGGIGGSFSEFCINSGNVCLLSRYNLNATSDNSLSINSSTLSKIDIYNGNYDIIRSPLYDKTPEFIVHEYDDKSNPLTIESKGLFTAYTWGYKGTLPVAKLDNLSYSSINADLKVELKKLEGYTALNDPSKRFQLKILNNTIRSKTPVGSQVSTYTYDPLFGITSQTDPNGITTYYEYDGLSRLKRVLDQDMNVLKENLYNYATQP